MAHKRTHTGGPFGGVNLGIIITPFLDMAFQLLAFFIMTYHPSALEGHIDGTLLPPTKFATKAKDNKPQPMTDEPPVDEEPKFNEAVLIKIRSIPQGQKEGDLWEGEPRWVELTRAEAATPQTINGNRDVVADRDDPEKDARKAWLNAYSKSLAKELDKELKKILKEPGSQNNDIKLEADANLKHRYWMRYYDTCKLAGFKNIRFVSPPATDRPK